MKRRLATFALLLLAACGSSPQPVSTGPRLVAEPAARFRDSDAPGRGAAFSPDGSLLATGSAAGPVVLRRMPDLKIVRRFLHPGGATDVAFAPGGQWLASSGYDGIVRLWDLAGGRPVRTLRGARGTLWTLDVAPAGDRLAAAGEDGLVRIWDPADGRLLARLAGHGRNVWEVRFSPDGRRLASGSFDNSARIWDSATGAAVAVLTDHEQAVVGLDWSPDGLWLATGGDDSAIFLRRASDGRTVRRLAVGNHAYALAFSRDSRWLANAGRARSGFATMWHGLTGAGGAGEPIHLWRVADGALVAALKMPADVAHLGFSPDGRWLAASADDGVVTLLRLRVGAD